MKTVILALLVLVVVSQGEALMCFCNYHSCQQICSGSNQVCANIIFESNWQIGDMMGCMDADDCSWWSSHALRATCCDRNFCNN